MKSFLLIASTIFIVTSCNQDEKKPADSPIPVNNDTVISPVTPVSNFTAPDQSPMDMIYSPSDYPIKKMTNPATELPYARIIYSRPQTQGRKIFGELVKYNQPWRMGANEATELELFSPATIQGKTVPRGRYTLFCIPTETNWTITLNGNIYSWGLQPDMNKNLFRFILPVEKNNTIIDYYTMAFENSGSMTNLIILWDDIRVNLPIKF